MHINIPLGIDIAAAAEFAINAAKNAGEDVEFKFNDFMMSVSPLSCARDIVTIWFLMCEVSRLNNALGVKNGHT